MFIKKLVDVGRNQSQELDVEVADLAAKFGFQESDGSLIKEIGGEKYTFAPMKGLDELSEAVALQQAVWELSDFDTCPPHMWITGIDTGGHVIGVRNTAGDLVAFIAAFGGYDTTLKQAFVLSDMAAVREDLRNLSIGFTLKLAQALYVLKQGITEIRWTYDPQRSRNAHLNIHKLGAIATDFFVDKYGESLAGSQNSEITDRFLVRWEVTPASLDQIVIRQARISALDGAEVVSPDNMSSSHRIAIAIPADIDTLTSEEKRVAQLSFRALATEYMTVRGYAAVGYVLPTESTKGFYILEKTQNIR